MKWTLRILGGLAIILLAAFLLLRTPDTDPAEMRAKYGGPPSQFVELASGLTVHLRDEGPRGAPAIILLHGSNADLHTWDPWTARLSDTYRVIRFDQRGHGLTGPAKDGDYSREAFAADVDAVADRLGLERFILAGNSMGGGIAMAYAMAHPERLAGLVLVDAGGAPIKHEGEGNLFFTLVQIPGVEQLLQHITPRSLVEKSLKQSVSNQAVVTPEAVDRYWDLARYPGNRAATMARFSQRPGPFDAADIAKVQVPTLVMWGEEDSLIPFEAAHWFTKNLPNAALVSYPGIGHIPMEEAAQKSASDLRGWMGTLPAGQEQPETGEKPAEAA